MNIFLSSHQSRSYSECFVMRLAFSSNFNCKVERKRIYKCFETAPLQVNNSMQKHNVRGCHNKVAKYSTLSLNRDR